MGVTPLAGDLWKLIEEMRDVDMERYTEEWRPYLETFFTQNESAFPIETLEALELMVEIAPSSPINFSWKSSWDNADAFEEFKLGQISPSKEARDAIAASEHIARIENFELF